MGDIGVLIMEIGSIVECTNDNWDCCVKDIKMPIKGKLYTVKGFCRWPKGEGIYIEECNDTIGVINSATKRFFGFHKTPFLKSRFAERLAPMKVEIEEIASQEA